MERGEVVGPKRTQRVHRSMLGFKNFESAAITVAGIELLRRIHKGQFTLDRLRFNGQAAPAIWNAVLAA